MYVTSVACASFKQKTKKKNKNKKARPRNKGCMLFLISHYSIFSYHRFLGNQAEGRHAVSCRFLCLLVYFSEIV